jgi:hypothetical protein
MVQGQTPLPLLHPKYKLLYVQYKDSARAREPRDTFTWRYNPIATAAALDTLTPPAFVTAPGRSLVW